MNKSQIEIGDKFGRLLIISKAEPGEQGKAQWLCKCSCGTEKVIKADRLKAKKSPTYSCGCSKRDIGYKDMSGERYGSLTVLWVAGRQLVGKKRKTPVLIWACQCDCGNIYYTQRGHLTRGDSKSCGCKTKEYVSKASLKMWDNRINKEAIEKLCPQCNRILPLSDFHKQARSRLGRASACRDCCRKDREKRGRKYHRVVALRNRFGLTWEQYIDLFNKANGCCSICNKPLVLLGNKVNKQDTPYVDHDHTTGKVRGILCGNCNAGLGLFEDNPERLEEAIKYLIPYK